MQFLGDVTLAAGEETSAEYSIFFPSQLPPREFILQMVLFSSINGEYLQTLFFNETINIIEEPTLLDTQLIFLYILGGLVLAVVGGRRCRFCAAQLALRPGLALAPADWGPVKQATHQLPRLPLNPIDQHCRLLRL